MTRICGIVAVGPNNEIGAAGKLLYPNQTDMAFFCGYTQNKLVVMGRKTADSIPGMLPGRDVVCVSRDASRGLDASKCVKHVWNGTDFNSLKFLAGGRDIVVVGGAEIYKMFSGKYDEICVTRHEEECTTRRDEIDAYFDPTCLIGLENRTFLFKGDGFKIYKFSK